MKAVNVVKIGGEVIDSEEALASFLDDFAALEGPKVLVHGGGREATRLSKAMGIETKMVNGRRVTDKDTLDIVTMVYAGLINKRITAGLQARDCDAVGLSGADGNAIPATRRNPEPMDFGFVGDIDPSEVNDLFIHDLLVKGKTPVLCAICHDGNGTLLNCNADTIAASVATACTRFAPVKLTYCFGKPGVLADVNDENSVIPHVTAQSFKDLKARGIVAEGMLPKLENALATASSGVKEVRICSATALNKEGGTTVTAE